MNKSGHIGTATETAVVRVLRARWPEAERRRLRGAEDWGDITGTHSKLVWEVKGGAAAKNASDGQIEAWLDETERERASAGANVGILVIPRRGIGPANADRWWAIFRWLRVMHRTPPPTLLVGPVRMHLNEACRMLHDWGY